MSYTTARHISLTDTAKLVRKALKAAYPSVTFSVRCSRYSMGQSIDVSWTDGPTAKQVEMILDQYEGHRFDGTDDSTHTMTQQVHGEEVYYEANYVHGQRTISPTFMRIVAEKLCQRYSITPVPPVLGTTSGHVQFVGVSIESTRYDNGVEDLSDAIHHAAHSMSAMPKPRITVYPDVTEVQE